MQTHTQKTFQITKKGLHKKAMKVYLRSDIPCGIRECHVCDNSKVENLISLDKNIYFLDSDLVLDSIEAFENFDILENSIMFMSEFLNLKAANQEIFIRFKKVLENKNIYIFPNQLQEECMHSIVSSNGTFNLEQQRELLFVNSCNYYFNHFQPSSKYENNSASMEIDNNEHSLLYALSNKQSFQSVNVKRLGYLEFAQLHSHSEEGTDFLNFISCKDSFEDVILKNLETKTSYTEYLPDHILETKTKKGELFKGVISITGLNYGIIKSKLFNTEFVVKGPNLNRALHGDYVCYEILTEDNFDDELAKGLLDDEDIIFEQKEAEEETNEEAKSMKDKIYKVIKSTKKQPTAKVVGIVRRTKTIFCGTIASPADIGKSVNLCDKAEAILNLENLQIFFPSDERYSPFVIKLYNANKYYNSRIMIRFDLWSKDSYFPLGHFIKMLGAFGDVKVENDVLLYEYNINLNPFTRKIINSLPKEDIELEIDPNELKVRRDLRNICICSIDPPGCKDIDDALHARILPNGNYEVGVHIADVTHYIKADTEIDQIASKTCNTVYLVHRRTDMLPKVLTENLCSLVAKNRYAFSVTWELDKNFNILKVDYFKSVIKSKASLTYEQANTIMNDKNDNSELAHGIRYLNQIAKHLKQKRIDDGALVLASTELKFNVDYETNSINDIRSYATFETNSLVEEFMLLANVYVAEKIYEAFPSCAVLRRHPTPKLDQLEDLSKLLGQKGINIKYNDSKTLADSLDGVGVNFKSNPFMNKLIRIMVTRTMNQAKYFGSAEFEYSDFRHYGLAMEIYTHFTSPIRRYCDVLVHRLLAAAIDIEPLPFGMSNKQKLNKLCDNMNKQNRKAFFCSRESNTYSVFLYFSKYADQIMDVVIHNIDKRQVSGISKDHGIETAISFDQNPVKTLNHELKEIILNDGTVIKLFDTIKIKIQVTIINYHRDIKFVYQEKIKF